MSDAAMVFKTDPKDSPITLEKAREVHINYLKAPDGPHVKDQHGKIVHSLFISKDELTVLMDGAALGLRLYFCRHNVTPEDLSINIIAAPVGTSGDIVSTSLINNLQPCPTVCPEYRTTDLNVATHIDGSLIWCYPNKKINGKIWFRPIDIPV